MTTRRLWPIAMLASMAAFAWGCDDGPDGGGDPFSDYPPPSPENLIIDLAASYEDRDVEQYAKLLDPEFIFYFQPADIPAGLEREYWNRDEDSTGTAALFNAVNQVTGIYVDLGAFTVEDSVRAEDPGVKRIRLTHSKLEVDLSDGTTLLVQGDIEDMYFRRGRAEAGTDSTKWYLFEWRDIRGGGDSPGSRAAPGAESDARAPAVPLVRPTTWGMIKNLFR